MRHFKALLLALVLVFVVSCDGLISNANNTSVTSPIDNPVTGVTINDGAGGFDLVLKQTVQLTANIQPLDAKELGLAWASENDAIATVSSSGLVTGVSKGTTCVSVTTVDGGFFASTEIRVSDANVPVESVVFTNRDQLSTKVYIGTTVLIIAGVQPSYASNPNIIWTSTNTNRATVDDGLVSFHSIGAVTISAISEENENISTSFSFNISTFTQVTGLTIAPVSNNRVIIGETLSLTTTIAPVNATNKVIDWSSSDEAIATVNNGVVSGLTQGPVTITATSNSNPAISDSIEIVVVPVNLPVESIEINNATSIPDPFYAGQSFQLTTTIIPFYATDDSIAWSSSDETRATVSGGLVYAKKSGPVIITATSLSNSAATDSITINITSSPNTTLFTDHETFDYVSPNRMPSVGDVRVLVFMLDFPDVPSTSAAITMAEAEKAFFGDSADTSWESLKSFYHKSSGGKLNISGDVYGWKTMTKPSDAYKVSSYTTQAEIIDEVLTYYNGTIDYSDYDANNDGCIDALYFVYSKGYNYNNNYWAYQWNYYGYNKYDQMEPNYYIWMSASFFTDNDSRTGMQKLNCQTLIHETGHLLDLDDYYDYDDGPYPNTSASHGGLGSADMMDYNIGDHNPHSKIMLGWIDPTVLTAEVGVNVNLTLSPSTSGQVIMVAPKFNNTIFTEYFLIDFFSATPTSIASHLTYYYGSQPGVRMYQVDNRLNSSKTGFAYNNGSTAHKLIRYVEASGTNKVENMGVSNPNLSSDALYRAGDDFGITTWTSNICYSTTSFRFTMTVNSITTSTADITLKITALAS